MHKSVCPECGAGYSGKRCRSCGYEPFFENPSVNKHVPSRKKQKKHPLLGFLILLALIAALMPVLRNWGMELEQVEQTHVVSEKENLYG